MNTILVLIGIALVLYFFEIFVPGGILAVMGVLCMLGAVYVGYDEFGLNGAMLTFGICSVISIGMLFLELALIKKYGAKRGIILTTTQKDYRETYQDADDSIIGQTGEALTTMAPSGTVKIGTRKYEAFSQDGYLGRGTSVVVVKKERFRLVVREQKA